MENNKKFTKFHIILHWIMALALFVLFFTGFLRMEWMNKKHIVSTIESKVAVSQLSGDELKAIASEILKPMWQWHKLFAHIFIFAFAARIIYMLVKGIRFPNPFAKGIAMKEKLQGFVYIYFYIFAFISVSTGICIEKHFFDAWRESIESVHKFGLYWFPIFVLLHFSGIVLAEYSNKKGIVSRMIGGD